MPVKLLSTDDFRDAAKQGTTPEGTVFRFSTTDPVVDQAGEDTRTVRFVFSDATVDHSHDTIDPKGWDLSVFNANPVALFAHNSWDPPIGRAHNVSVMDGKLAGDIEFAGVEVYPFADTIYRLVKGGFLKAVSVGFKPKDWAFSNDADRPYGIDFKKQTLLEISVCPVPCNPNALTEARSVGIDTAPLRAWAEKVLDTGETVIVPRKEIEALRAQVAPIFLQMPKGAALTDGATIELVPATETKAGRKLSAATMAKLEEAMTHHDQMGACIRALMTKDEDEGMSEDGDGLTDPPAEPDDDGLTPDPPGTTVVNTATPEEQRLAEVRALKASLTPND